MFKLLLTTTAVMTLAVPALASKARMAALQNAPQIYDTQSIFDNPARSFMLGDWAALEMGATSTTSMGANTPENVVTNGTTARTFYNANAEGGFVRSHGDSKFGFYLGRKSAVTTRVRSLLGFQGQDNPVELMYGFQASDLKFGASINYSKSEPKVPGQAQSQDSLGARLGVMGSVWEAAVTFGLGSNATGNAPSAFGLTAASPTSEYKGTTGFKVSGGYWFDTVYAYANYYQDGLEATGVTGASIFTGVTAATIEQTQYEVGVIDTIKSEGLNFFYGVSYIGFKSDDKKDNTAVDAGFDVEQTQMPFVIGVEADATPWLVLRASAKQNFIVGETKRNAANPFTAATMTASNNTTVALGTGLRFNKFTLDATLGAGFVPGGGAAATPATGAGDINANSLFGNASLTYMF